MPDITTLLPQAISALSARNAQLAITLCDNILALSLRNADAYHIKALAHKMLNHQDQAQHCFEQSLNIKPEQPAVLSNFANLMMTMGKFDQASSLFEESTRLDRGNKDAWLNWAIMLSNLKKYEQAKTKLEKAIETHHSDHRLFSVLGNICQKMEEFEYAVTAFQRALQLQPTDLQSLHNLGVTYRLMNKPTEALICYQRIQQLNHQYPELYFNLGCAFYDLNNKSQAIDNLKLAISLKADYVEAHEALNKLYWEDGDQHNFLLSYQHTLQQLPLSASMLFSYIAMLIMSKQNEKAQAMLDHAINKIGRQHPFLHALAILKYKQSITPDVLDLLLEAHRQQPDNTRYLIDIANYYICNEHYSQAMDYIERAEYLAPLNQEVIAYKGLCWRLAQNPKAEWLNNYDSFIDAKLLDVPDGYEDLTDFMTQLKVALLDKHGAEHQPLDQSVMGGTQTMGRLLSEPQKVIQDFKHVLERRISDYLSHLPHDPSHPFLKRNNGQFKFSGSWSVRLKSGGFHINHVHPEGWLSCCTYVDIPENINPHDPLKAGWIKFGETSLGLQHREYIGTELCPLVGLCVIFPSFFWHGTNTFASQQHRLTIPCDIMPV